MDLRLTVCRWLTSVTSSSTQDCQPQIHPTDNLRLTVLRRPIAMPRISAGTPLRLSLARFRLNRVVDDGMVSIILVQWTGVLQVDCVQVTNSRTTSNGCQSHAQSTWSFKNYIVRFHIYTLTVDYLKLYWGSNCGLNNAGHTRHD